MSNVKFLASTRVTLLHSQPNWLRDTEKCLQETERLMTEWKVICPTQWKLYHGQVLPKKTTLNFLNFSKEIVYHIRLSDDSLKTRRYLRNMSIVYLYSKICNHLLFSGQTYYWRRRFTPHFYLLINNMKRKTHIIYWMT